MWTYFANALRDGVESLTRYSAMLGKIYFPRLILPLSAIIGKLLDLAVVSVLFIPLMLCYGYIPRLEAIVVVPALIVVLLLATLGLGLWLSAAGNPVPRRTCRTHSYLQFKHSCTCHQSSILTVSFPTVSAFFTA